MKTTNRLQKLLPGLLLAAAGLSLLVSGTALAERDEYADLNAPPKTKNTYTDIASWSIAFDNDIFVPGGRDQDYTYGINLTYAGPQAENLWASLHRSLDWINLKLDFDGIGGPGLGASKIEYGLFGFTPEDISLAAANPNDRPYASLVYVSATRETYYPAGKVSWQSTLTVGLLGLSLVGDMQNLVHSAYDGNRAQGWGKQISDGGEPTARYSLARQSLLYRNDSGIEVKSTWQASVGYITEAAWSLSLRAGKIHTPWVSFNPELTSYAEKSVPNSGARVSERYFWTGLSFRYRAYNAFLEGQFRDSAVTWDSDDINHAIVEAWLGYTVAFNNGYSITYSLRGHTSELKHGDADRSVVWGGILISRTIG
jgi:hypothetical protein